jgi:hypothetical protein
LPSKKEKEKSMRNNSILSYVKAVPFRPFRIVMNSGKTYDVRHPETIAVGRDTFIYYYRPQPGKPFDRVDMVSLLLVENLEHLDQGTSNKHGKKK